MSKKILDLSKWQRGKITNWEFVKKEVDGIILRLGFRGYNDGAIYTDITFKEFANKCKTYDIPFGVYWFAQEITEKESIEAAKFVINNIKDYKLDYPIYYDVEASGAPNNSGRADKISRYDRTKCAIAFCEEIKRQGYQVGIYSSESYFDKLLVFDNIKKYNIWCAKYSKNSGMPENSPKIKYDMWQYTSNGTIKGINSKVDLSLYNASINTKKSVDEIVQEVIDGLWGVGITRKQSLIEAGYDYSEIQDKINKIYNNILKFKVGDKVKLDKDAVYSNGKRIPSWIKNKVLFIRSDIKENGNVVISILKQGPITGIVNKKYLIKL